MAGNKVLVEFDGKNDGLKKTTKESKEDIDKVKKSSQETDEQLKKTGDTGNQAGEKIGRGFKIGAAAVAAASVAAAAMVGKLVNDSVKAYADFEQLSGGVEKLFGEAGTTVMANADQAYKSAGLSANAYMETVTGISASLISGLGGDTQQAAALADKAIRDMSDNANTYGTDMESIQRTYQGFAKSQFGMLDNLKLGYGGSASEMARLINDSGVLGDTMVTASSVSEVSMDKIIEAIHKTQETMGIAGTTAKEAASTISGSLASTQAAWTNVLAAMASSDDAVFMDALDGLVESAGNVLQNLLVILPTIVESIVGLFKQLIPKIPPALEKLLPVLIDGVVELLNGIVSAIPDMLKVLTKIIPKLVKGFVKIFLSLLDALPQILDGLIQLFTAIADALLDPATLVKVVAALSKAIISIVDVIVKMMKDPTALQKVMEAAVILLTEIVKALPDIIIAMSKMTPAIIESLVAFLTKPENLKMIFMAMVTLGWELIKAIPQVIVGIISSFGELLPSMGGLFGRIGDKIKEIWNGLVDWFKDIPSKISGAFKSVTESVKGIFTKTVDGVKDIFKGGINWIIKKINNLIGKFNDISGKVPGIDLTIDKIPELAGGGYINYAAGGRVSGPGSGTSDSIPAMLSNGEFVLRASAVKNLGVDNLTMLNEGKTPKSDAPLVGQIVMNDGADPLALAQQLGAMVRFA